MGALGDATSASMNSMSSTLSLAESAGVAFGDIFGGGAVGVFWFDSDSGSNTGFDALFRGEGELFATKEVRKGLGLSRPLEYSLRYLDAALRAEPGVWGLLDVGTGELRGEGRGRPVFLTTGDEDGFEVFFGRGGVDVVDDSRPRPLMFNF